MKKKEHIRGIIIAIILILIAIISIVMFLLIKTEKLPSIFKEEEMYVSKRLIEEQDWDTEIVTNITTDNVPITKKLSYASGNIFTGTIMEDENGCRYLWVPYDENATIDISEYYTNVSEYYEIESDEMASIEKYKGFFVALNMSEGIESLKSISDEDYSNHAKQMQEVEDEGIRKILSKEQLEQILNYTNSSKFNIADNTIGIESIVLPIYSNARVSKAGEKIVEQKNSNDVTSDEVEIHPTEDTDDEKVKNMLNEAKEIAQEQYKGNYTDSSEETIYVLKTEEYPAGVPIPAGYKKNITDGIVSIQDSNNANLVYVWVPLSYDELTTRKQELTELYKNYTNADGEKLKVDEGSEIYEGLNNTSEELPEAFVNSIKKWGGFYISEAEMGYDSNGKFYNKARGMVENTVTKTIHGGDYYRGNTTKNFTFENVKSLAENVTADRTDIVSHLMYGVEYDAVLLWINKTNPNYLDDKGNNISKILLENSTYVGKYINSNRGATATAEKSSSYINKIWGIGGNLAELTQERSGNSYVIRGGSWNDTGEEAPIASRKITEDISTDKIGFRTCIYINENLTPTTEIVSDDYETTIEDDTIFAAGDYVFDIWSETTRYVHTWDGLKIYSQPKTSADVFDTLGIASTVIVNAKAKEKDSTTNIWWARIKLSNGSMGYINANLLTDTTTNVSGHEFVMKEKVTRYHNNNLNVYTTADESSSKLTTIEFTGAVEVIGKSTDFEWAVVRIDGKTGYVKANDLRVTKKAETIGNYSFFIGDEVQRNVSNSKGANLYQNPGDTDVTTTIEYGTLVTINAITEDGEIARINYNGEQYYIYTSDLSLPGPTLEVSINKDTGIATIKAKNIGRGVKAIYKDGKAINGNWKNDYYVVTIQTYKDNKYNITAEDEQGNISVYGYLKTSDIKVEDPTKKPVEPTTPTTSTGNSSSNSGSSGSSSSGSTSSNSGSTGSSSSGSNSSGSSSSSGDSSVIVSSGSSSSKDTEAPVAKALYYTYDNKSFTQIKDGDTIKATKKFYLWIQLEDNMVSGKNLYAYKTSAKKNDRISEAISSTEGSGNYKGLYYIVDTISANGTYYYQLCDGSANSPYSYVSVIVQGLTSSTSSALKLETPSVSTTSWTNEDVKISFCASTSIGVKNFYIKGKLWDEAICLTATKSSNGKYYGEYNATYNDTYEIYAQDTNGNCSEKKTKTISNIDKYPPTVYTITSYSVTVYEKMNAPAESGLLGQIAYKKKQNGRESWEVVAGSVYQGENTKFVHMEYPWLNQTGYDEFIWYFDRTGNWTFAYKSRSTLKTGNNLKNPEYASLANIAYKAMCAGVSSSGNSSSSGGQITPSLGGSTDQEEEKNDGSDKEAPKLTAYTPNTTEWTNNATITLKATDNKEVKYFYAKSSATNKTKKYSATKSGDYYSANIPIDSEGEQNCTVWAEDSSGNTSSTRVVKVKVDKTTPTFDFDYHANNTSYLSLTQKVKCSDSLSGIDYINLYQKKLLHSSYEILRSHAAGTWEWPFALTTTYRIEMYDKAGNHKSVYIKNKKASYNESDL